MSSTNVGDAVENTCVVCFKNVTIYSIGECDHPVCYECSTRMRVLCRQNECPICRQDMPKVIFTKNVQPFKNIANNLCLIDKKFKICFESAEIQAAYSKLLEHVCTICPGRPAFRTFNNLKDHMRKEHELHYCDLCVDNLKIFTAERRCYTRQELAQHRRKGDPDDKSHRGHPLCEFCDQRYMDNDELFRHLRRDHLFCHFCDADGYHQYYSSYDYLREHFRVDHFLCEEGSCVDEKFTSAFRTEIDLKAHRASVHGRAMGKAAAKQARTLELEFTLAPRARGERGGAERGGAERWGASGRGRGRAARAEEEPLGAAGPPLQPPPTLPAPAPRTHCPAEFPSLNGATAISSGPGPASGVTIRSVRQAPLAVTDENFPALGGMDASTATLRLSVNSDRAGDALSIRVNRRAEAPGRIRPTGRPLRLGLDDFPSLSADPAAPSPAGQWVPLERRGRRGPPGSSTGPKPEPKAAPRLKIVQEDFPVLASATTGVEARVKASSVVIPVTPNNTWQHANRSNPPSAVSANCSLAPPATKQEPTKLAAIKVKSKKKKQQQAPSQAKVGVEKTGKELGKRKKRDDAAEVTPPRSGEEEITSKLEGILMGRDGEAAGAERKRSELLIGALHSDAAGSSDAQARACPPGFGRASGSAPPPGFASVAGPPPGFSSVTLNSVARSPAPLSANAITFTSSSGRSYPIVPRAEGGGHAGEGAAVETQSDALKEGRAFVEPHDADRRNQALVERIRRVVPMEGFLQLSAFFRQGSLSASAFHSHCRHLLGATAFAEAFPELLVLLPDISKQQELLAAHESEEGHFSVSVETCEHCGQVLAPEDVLHHQSAHKKEKNSISSASDLKTSSVLTALPTVAMESNNGLFGSHW